MLENQMDIIVRLEYFVELQNIRVPDFSEQVYFVMEWEHRFYVVIKHFFRNCFQSKLSFICWIKNFVHFCEVSFANDISDLVMASQILKHAEILYHVVPFLQRWMPVSTRDIHLVFLGLDTS